jgi:hypothetical protein
MRSGRAGVPGLITGIGPPSENSTMPNPWIAEFQIWTGMFYWRNTGAQCFGSALVGRQGPKAGGPRQPLAIALPTKAEAVVGLCHNPRDPKKIPHRRDRHGCPESPMRWRRSAGP